MLASGRDPFNFVDGAQLAPGREQRLQPGAKIQFGNSSHWYVFTV